MKINYYVIACLYFSFLALIPVSCAGKEKRSIIDSINKESTTSTLQTTQSEMKISQKATENSSQQKNTKKTTVNVDTNKIYEQSEIKEAICPLSNSELSVFTAKNFKNINNISINGIGLADIIVERDGAISDVIIVKSLHPEIDKEFIRALKLLPKFTPGEIKGHTVRSKFRMPLHSKTF